MMRTYLDETALGFGGATLEGIRSAIDDICDVADAVRSHEDEVLLRAADIYEFEVRPNVKLVDFLYPNEPDGNLVDARRRLQIAIDKTTIWDGSNYEIATPSYDVTVDGTVSLAPSLSQAVAAHFISAPVAVLALRTARETGAIFARSAAATDTTPVASLIVLTTPSDRPPFVRRWILAHPPTPANMQVYCERAFPRLRWTDSAHAGLRSNGNAFFNDRFETTMRHLAVLNDYAAEIFWREKEPVARETELNHHAVVASAESPNTRANHEARTQRTGRWNNQDVYFSWHTKIRWNSGRIHFHHDTACDAPGQIVLGYLVDHFKT